MRTFFQAVEYQTGLTPPQVRFLLRIGLAGSVCHGRERRSALALARRNLVAATTTEIATTWKITEAGTIVLKYAAMMALRAALE